VGTRCADHVTPLYPQKLALTSPTGGGRSVDIVRPRTKATEKCKCTSRKSHVLGRAEFSYVHMNFCVHFLGYNLAESELVIFKHIFCFINI